MQSELGFLQGAKQACYRCSRALLRQPSDPDFAALRFIPDSLPGCCVDVGANRGQSIAAIRLFKPRARIHSFEPNPELAAALARRYRGRAAISVHAFGLADVAGGARLFIPVYKGCVYDGLASLDRQSAATWLSPETLYGFSERRLAVRETVCRTERLDDQHLDPFFIKIDVQGREFEVVRGGIETIRRLEPVLMIEDLSHRPRLAALLHDLGYRQYLFDATGFFRADAGAVVNFLLMTDRRAGTVIRSRMR